MAKLKAFKMTVYKAEQDHLGTEFCILHISFLAIWKYSDLSETELNILSTCDIYLFVI